MRPSHSMRAAIRLALGHTLAGEKAVRVRLALHAPQFGLELAAADQLVVVDQLGLVEERVAEAVLDRRAQVERVSAVLVVRIEQARLDKEF